MSQVSITVNGFPCTSVRFLLPWVGLWLADLEVALTPSQLEAFAISGPAVIAINGTTYPGTIDPLNSNSFVDRLFLRVVAGKGGWNQLTLPKQYYSQNGELLSTDVYRDTAAAVGEPTPLDPTPQKLAQNFERMATSASSVFGDLDWYVDPPTGVVNVAQWPAATPDASFTLDQYHPVNATVMGTCDILFLPGTQIADPRLNGQTLVARTVEQRFTHEGSHVQIWCSQNPVERLSEAFAIACRQAVQTAYLKVYQYRFVLTPSGTDLALQAITAGAPDLNPISQWQSLSGSSTKYAPSTVVLVGFTGDSPPAPYLVSTSPLATPLEIDLKAQNKVIIDVSAPGAEIDVGATAGTVNVGSSISFVNLGGGATTLATGPWAIALAAAMNTFAGALLAALDPTVSSAAGELQTALIALPDPATIGTKAT